MMFSVLRKYVNNTQITNHLQISSPFLSTRYFLNDLWLQWSDGLRKIRPVPSGSSETTHSSFWRSFVWLHRTVSQILLLPTGNFLKTNCQTLLFSFCEWIPGSEAQILLHGSSLGYSFPAFNEWPVIQQLTIYLNSNNTECSLAKSQTSCLLFLLYNLVFSATHTLDIFVINISILS